MGAGAASQTFTLALSLAAPVSDLRDWLAGAQAGAAEVYASGFDLPRASGAVALVKGWQEQGFVTLTSRRDPNDRRRTQWLVVRTGADLADPVQPEDAGSACTFGIHERALLTFLEDLALARKACPSWSALADAARLPDPKRKGLHRARYVLGQLQKKRLIAVETVDRPAADGGAYRVVTILTGTRAKGRRTARISKGKANV